MAVTDNGVERQSDDAYLTVMPNSNPHVTGDFSKNESLSTLMAKVERANRISNQLTRGTGFITTSHVNGLYASTVINRPRVPFNAQYYQLRPIIRGRTVTPTREAETVY